MDFPGVLAFHDHRFQQQPLQPAATPNAPAGMLIVPPTQPNPPAAVAHLPPHMMLPRELPNVTTSAPLSAPPNGQFQQPAPPAEPAQPVVVGRAALSSGMLPQRQPTSSETPNGTDLSDGSTVAADEQANTSDEERYNELEASTRWDEPTPCTVCHRMFATKYQAKKHFMRLHYRGKKRYGCTRCGTKSFAVKEDLTTHLKACGRVFVCSCGMRLRSRPTLKRHCNLTGHTAKSWDGFALARPLDASAALGIQSGAAVGAGGESTGAPSNAGFEAQFGGMCSSMHHDHSNPGMSSVSAPPLMPNGHHAHCAPSAAPPHPGAAPHMLQLPGPLGGIPRSNVGMESELPLYAQLQPQLQQPQLQQPQLQQLPPHLQPPPQLPPHMQAPPHMQPQPPHLLSHLPHPHLPPQLPPQFPLPPQLPQSQLPQQQQLSAPQLPPQLPPQLQSAGMFQQQPYMPPQHSFPGAGLNGANHSSDVLRAICGLLKSHQAASLQQRQAFG